MRLTVPGYPGKWIVPSSPFDSGRRSLTLFVAAFMAQIAMFGLTAISAQTPAVQTSPIQTLAAPTSPAQSSPAQSGPIRQPTIHARLATGLITIDGKLNEPAWQDAEPVQLIQQSPHEGVPSPYRTEVRVLVYHDALVFGFKCYDANPAEIQTHTLARDGDMGGDDSVSIALDSFGDKRTGYFFLTNSSAARFDGLISGQGNLSSDWDGIWNVRTARTDYGWSAEMWIPAQTLNFVGGTGHWGLELDRFIERDQTELRWASPTLNSDLYDMSRAGNLEIMAPLKQGHGLEFAPYASGRMVHDFVQQDRNWLGAGGGELTWRITPQIAAILTVNTDFAETEVDSRQINITPFPLYFPEKRAFFLEGANQYTFGLGLDTTSTFIPFFSRNIGLLDGYNIPIAGGLKLNGHVGPWSIALLDVQTRKTFVPDTVVTALGLASAKVEGTNLLAARFAYDLDKHLRLGTIVTNGDPEARLSNTMGGMDAVWHTSTFLKKYAIQAGGWAASTQGQVPSGKREAWGLRFEYPNDLINCSADTNRFGDGFNPLLAFLQRPATHQVDAACSYRPRPSPDGPFHAVRQDFFDAQFMRITDTVGNLQSQSLVLTPLHFTLNSGASFQLLVNERHETLTTPFAVVPTVIYPIGSYNFERYGLRLTSSQQRPIQFSNESFIGSYYNGHLWHQTNTLLWTPLHGRAQASLSADNYFAHTPQGNFVEKLWQFNGVLSWSPDLSLSTFVQYDNVSFGLSSNTRLRWTFRPGDDFFVIWDRTWVRNTLHPGVNLDPDAESITAKIRWTFRL